MHLPIADHLKPERTHHRLPRREPSTMGLYVEQEGNLSRLNRIDEVWRTEVRIGAQTRIDPRMPLELRESIHRDTKGLIMRELYGPIHAELYKVIDDFYRIGVNRGDPAFERVAGMIDTLGRAFQGDTE